MVKLAVVQASPVFFDKAAGIDKLCGIVEGLKSENPDLVLFPEVFIPGYPWDMAFGTRIGSRTGQGRESWKRVAHNSIEVPSKDTKKMGKAAKKADCFLAVGIMERERGTLYCSLLYFGPDGSLLGKHRKLKPTAAERVIWGEGDGSTLFTLNAGFGIVGGLICWENYMPLARMSMYLKGVEFYLAPTADQRESWQTTLQHIAVEGRCFVLGCNQYVTRSMFPAEIAGAENFPVKDDVLCRGGSVIISPTGKTLAGPVWDREEVILAEVDTGEILRAKMDLDVSGHYNRPDVFRFQVPDQPETYDYEG